VPIKGKGKTRSRRTVTRGPKLAYVEPPKPLWRRRWVQVTAGILLVGAIVAIALTALSIKRSNDRKDARLAAVRHDRVIVTEFGGTIDQGIASLGQQVQTTVLPFPQLSDDLSKLKAGTLSPPEAAKAGAQVARLARQAYTTIQKVDVATLINGGPRLLPLSDAQDSLVASLQVYEQIGKGLSAAAGEDGSARNALIQQNVNLVPVAQQLFQSGYQRISTLRTDLGIPTQPALPPQPSPPAAQPSPSTSASATATPKAKSSKGTKKTTPTPTG